MVLEKKKVQILLSTYNGEKYISDQIESIIAQENVDVHILIRDDGSKDNTINEIQTLIKKYPSKIELIRGKNVGFKKSFLELCCKTSRTYDYYAFSDQDDFWLSRKIEVAINYLSKNNNKLKLYASTVNIADENLNFLYKKNISNFVNTLGSTFTRGRLAGCTYVFNNGLLNVIRKFPYNKYSKTLISHDGLTMISCQALNGYIYIDNNSYILHRRREGSVTSGGNGLKKRIKGELSMIFNHKKEKSVLADYLLKNYSEKLSTDNLELVTLISNYSNSLKNHTKLLFDSRLNSGLKLANLEMKIKIITNML